MSLREFMFQLQFLTDPFLWIGMGAVPLTILIDVISVISIFNFFNLECIWYILCSRTLLHNIFLIFDINVTTRRTNCADETFKADIVRMSSYQMLLELFGLIQLNKQFVFIRGILKFLIVMSYLNFYHCVLSCFEEKLFRLESK